MAIKPLVASLGMICATQLAAEPLFIEDFEALVPDSTLQAGALTSGHGVWMKLPVKTRPGRIVVEGNNQILELTSSPDFPLGSRILGYLGTSEAPPTQDRLIITFRFKITAPLHGVHLQIIGKDGRSKGTLGISEDGIFTVSHAGERKLLGQALKPDHWYAVKMVMPPSPTTSKNFDVTLSDAETGEEQGATSGRLSRSVDEGGENYQYIDFQHNTPGESLYIDDLRVDTSPD